MARTLSWKWLCSPFGVRHAGRRKQVRCRPCLAALEQLEDRVQPSAAAPDPIFVKVSAQGLSTINAFFKIEIDGIAAQDKFLADENSFIQQAQKTNNPLPSAIVDYFLKIDEDFIKIDTDFIGQQGGGTPGITSATTAAPGSLDAILTGLQLPIDTDIKLEAQIVPAVGKAMQDTNALIGQLNNLPKTTAVIHPAAAVDYFLKIDTAEAKHKDEIQVLSFSFGVIENQLINTDPNDFGPALGLQGSATPGPAGGLLLDLAGLSADVAAVPSNNTGGLAGSASAVDAFLKREGSFQNAEAAFIHFAQKASAKDLTSGDIAYLQTITGELIQVNNDLTAINNVLLQNNLPAKTQAAIQNLQKNIGADSTTLKGLDGYRDIIGDLNGDGTPDLSITKEWDAASPAFAALENVLGSLDSTGQLGTTSNPGLMAGLVQDSLVLSADAGGTAPGVDAFLTLEGQINNTQNAFLKIEQGFFAAGGQQPVQLPSAIVDYFLKIDDAFLEIDSGLIDTTSNGPNGTTTNPGLNTILKGITPALYGDKIDALTTTVTNDQKMLMADESTLQNQSGSTPTAAQVDYFLKIDGVRGEFAQAFAAINANLLDAENQLLSVIPTTNQNYGSAIQDSKNIADGAAKGQAQE